MMKANPWGWILGRGALGLALTTGALSFMLGLIDLGRSTLNYDDDRAVQGIRVSQSALATTADSRAVWTGDVHLVIADAPFGLKLEAALPHLMLGAAVLIAAALLFSVALDLQREAGFTGSSVRALRLVVLVIALTSILRVYVGFLADRAVLAHAAAPGGRVTAYPYSGPNWIDAVPALAVAAVLLIVVEAFRQGQGLLEDTVGLV